MREEPVSPFCRTYDLSTARLYQSHRQPACHQRGL